MIELITVMVIIGILGAIGAARFFDNTLFESRAYADQAKSIIRYAQKLAIAQNRKVFVRSDGGGFAACFTFDCSAGNLANTPSGNNSGSSATTAWCTSNGTYVATWLCEGKPTSVTVATSPIAPARPELTTGGYFYFDALGRPYNKADVGGNTSSFTTMPVDFSSGTNIFRITVEAETGYVH